MINKENKLVIVNGKEKYIEGYFLTIEQITTLVRDFIVDSFDGFVSNDESYLESKLKDMDYE